MTTFTQKPTRERLQLPEILLRVSCYLAKAMQKLTKLLFFFADVTQIERQKEKRTETFGRVSMNVFKPCPTFLFDTNEPETLAYCCQSAIKVEKKYKSTINQLQQSSTSSDDHLLEWTSVYFTMRVNYLAKVLSFRTMDNLTRHRHLKKRCILRVSVGIASDIWRWHRSAEASKNDDLYLSPTNKSCIEIE